MQKWYVEVRSVDNHDHVITATDDMSLHEAVAKFRQLVNHTAALTSAQYNSFFAVSTATIAVMNGGLAFVGDGAVYILRKAA